MTTTELNQLADLLVRHHNNTNDAHCSWYGWTMDRALARDTFSTLYSSANADFNALKAIESKFYPKTAKVEKKTYAPIVNENNEQIGCIKLLGLKSQPE